MCPKDLPHYIMKNIGLVSRLSSGNNVPRFNNDRKYFFFSIKIILELMYVNETNFHS